ncbi:hypothetical protein GCM10010493_81070 [Streptomyces lavendulae subsp. grasserius]
MTRKRLTAHESPPGPGLRRTNRTTGAEAQHAADEPAALPRSAADANSAQARTRPQTSSPSLTKADRLFGAARRLPRMRQIPDRRVAEGNLTPRLSAVVKSDFSSFVIARSWY